MLWRAGLFRVRSGFEAPGADIGIYGVCLLCREVEDMWGVEDELEGHFCGSYYDTVCADLLWSDWFARGGGGEGVASV